MKLTSLSHRIERLERQHRPGDDIPPFHVIDPAKDAPDEIAAKEREVAEYERRHPQGPAALIIRLRDFSVGS